MSRATSRIIASARANTTLNRLIPTLDFLLEEELSDCESVLDLGCGPLSPVRRLRGRIKSVGVEAFEPYVEAARLNSTHDQVICSKILDIDFDAGSFDAVILIDVIEHLSEEDGYRILEAAQTIAKKKVIVNSPNGFIAQSSLDDNPLQAHLSGWSFDLMKSLGFRTTGLAGLKVLRREVDSPTMGADLLVSIRFRPRLFWFCISAMSQVVTSRLPRYAFSIFSVLEVNKAHHSRK